MTGTSSRRKYVRGTISERLAAWSEERDGCLVYAGKLNYAGYARIYTPDGPRYAHRLVYQIAHGPVPDEMRVDHMCHNRACIRLDHLQLVTQKQNCENAKGANARNATGVRGVYWSKSHKRFIAQVKHNQVSHHVGSFRDLAEAEAAVIAKRNELFTNNIVDRRRHDLS